MISRAHANIHELISKLKESKKKKRKVGKSEKEREEKKKTSSWTEQVCQQPVVFDVAIVPAINEHRFFRACCVLCEFHRIRSFGSSSVRAPSSSSSSLSFISSWCCVIWLRFFFSLSHAFFATRRILHAQHTANRAKKKKKSYKQRKHSHLRRRLLLGCTECTFVSLRNRRFFSHSTSVRANGGFRFGNK